MGSLEWATALPPSSEVQAGRLLGTSFLAQRLTEPPVASMASGASPRPRPSPAPRPRPPPLRPPRARGLAPRGLPRAQRPTATGASPTTPARSLCSGGLAGPRGTSGSEGGGGTGHPTPWRLVGSWTSPGNRRAATCCWRCWRGEPTSAEVGARRSGCTGQAQTSSVFSGLCAKVGRSQGIWARVCLRGSGMARQRHLNLLQSV